MGLRSAFDLLLDSKDPLSSLDGLIWQSLEAASASKKHPWNEGTFSTAAVTASGHVFPKSRTVVVRNADRAAVSLDFHTDFRSAKVSELQNSRVCWLFYAPATSIQLRLEGTARVVDGEEADVWWDRTTLASRSSYLSLDTPGTPTPGTTPPATGDRFVSQSDSERGRVNFRVVRTCVELIDWLYLRREGHVRARIRYQGASPCECQWVVP